jgi:hypothetical protein
MTPKPLGGATKQRINKALAQNGLTRVKGIMPIADAKKAQAAIDSVAAWANQIVEEVKYDEHLIRNGLEPKHKV